MKINRYNLGYENLFRDYKGSVFTVFVLFFMIISLNFEKNSLILNCVVILIGLIYMYISYLQLKKYKNLYSDKVCLTIVDESEKAKETLLKNLERVAYFGKGYEEDMFVIRTKSLISTEDPHNFRKLQEKIQAYSDTLLEEYNQKNKG